jgi:hypothetical protein
MAVASFPAPAKFTCSSASLTRHGLILRRHLGKRSLEQGAPPHIRGQRLLQPKPAMGFVVERFVHVQEAVPG